MIDSTITDRRGKEAIISSVRVVTNGHHTYLSVYSRGELTGRLGVAAQDAVQIVNRLIPLEFQGT